MEFIEPLLTGFTIYSKSGCSNCIKVKNLLKEKNFLFNVVDCDEYIIEEKDLFLSFIKEHANKECKMFPIVFINGKYIGGYIETRDYIDNELISFDEILDF